MKNSYKIALLALALTSNLAPLLAAPAIKLLALDFPDSSPVLIQLIVTFSSFFVVPSLLAVGTLSEKFSKKSILVFGLILYLIGGVGPAFMNSISGILVFRAILGLSIGLITAMLNSLIAENFYGNERTRMNGMITAISGLGGAVFLTIGGTIANLGWRGVFFTYSYVIILALLVALYIPHVKPQRIEMAGIRVNPFRLPPKVYLIGLGIFGILILYFAIFTNLAIYIADSGLGNAATVGYVTAISLVAMFIGGFFVNRVIGLFKEATMAFILLLFCLTFVTMSFAHVLVMVVISVVLVGLGIGMVFPVLMDKLLNAALKERLASAISLFLVFTYLGQFVTPIVLQGIHLLGTSTLRGKFLFIGVVAGTAFIIACIVVMKKHIKNVLHTASERTDQR